ncbi:MAG: thiol peroxidase [Cyclobacteriaceae bacterium]|nr:thiol peroxidase [Cyclobacteriaceae bacterium]
MAHITLGGNPVTTVGVLPKVGSPAPDFKVTKTDLTDTTLSDYLGKNVVLNIFPSIGTGVCSAAVRKFNELAAGLNNTVVVCVSRDLPFAHQSFCEAEGIENVIPASEYKDNGFSDNYHVKMLDGKFEGLLSRSIVVIDSEGKVVYTEQVPEIAQEPDYDKVLAALK